MLLLRLKYSEKALISQLSPNEFGIKCNLNSFHLLFDSNLI